MKLAIFGHVRSGTTMLSVALWKHLVHIKENTVSSHIGEIFNPADSNMVIEEDGYLKMVPLPAGTDVQLRPTRFELFKKHTHQDYVVKFMSQDTKTPGIVEWMRDNYRIIAIERRNPLAAFLSGLIAYHYQVWHVQSALGQTRPDYQPFVVERDVMNAIGTHFVRYYQYRDALAPTSVMYYEDIANATMDKAIQLAGMKPTPTHQWEYESFGTTKLHSFQEKMDLILNMDEVTEHFMGILSPYNVAMEYNDY